VLNYLFRHVNIYYGYGNPCLPLQINGITCLPNNISFTVSGAIYNSTFYLHNDVIGEIYNSTFYLFFVFTTVPFAFDSSLSSTPL